MFTSVCSNPLKYPADVFARNVIFSVGSNPDISSDVTVIVYVNENAHALEFEKKFKENTECRIAAPRIPVPKAITGPVSSFITLTNGDIFQQQVNTLEVHMSCGNGSGRNSDTPYSQAIYNYTHTASYYFYAFRLMSTYV